MLNTLSELLRDTWNEFNNEAKRRNPRKRPAIPIPEMNIFVTQPLTPQMAAPLPSTRSERGLARVILGVIASLGTFLVGILIGIEQRRDRVR